MFYFHNLARINDMATNTKTKGETYYKCKTIAVDGCEDYIRVIGNEEDYKVITK